VPLAPTDISAKVAEAPQYHVRALPSYLQAMPTKVRGQMSNPWRTRGK